MTLSLPTVILPKTKMKKLCPVLTHMFYDIIGLRTDSPIVLALQEAGVSSITELNMFTRDARRANLLAEEDW
jgi:hypothetical protein